MPGGRQSLTQWLRGPAHRKDPLTPGVHPSEDDYIFFSQYGDDYFSNPERNMNSYNGYGLGLYGHYLNSIYNQKRYKTCLGIRSGNSFDRNESKNR